MKKITAAILALVMVFALCACGAPKEINVECNGESVKSLEFELNGEYSDEELTLTGVLGPKGAKGEIEWESSDKDVVRVKDNGDGSCTLKLKGEGDAKITASCGDVKAKVKISIEAGEAAADEAAEEAASDNPVISWQGHSFEVTELRLTDSNDNFATQPAPSGSCYVYVKLTCLDGQIETDTVLDNEKTKSIKLTDNKGNTFTATNVTASGVKFDPVEGFSIEDYQESFGILYLVSTDVSIDSLSVKVG